MRRQHFGGREQVALEMCDFSLAPEFETARCWPNFMMGFSVAETAVSGNSGLGWLPLHDLLPSK